MYIYHHLSALRHYYIEHSLSVNRNEQLIIPKTLVSPYENPTITSFLIISFANSLDFNQSANMQTSSTFAAGRRDHWAIVLNKDDTPMPDASPAQAPSLPTPSSIVPLELLVPPLPPFNEGQMRFCATLPTVARGQGLLPGWAPEPQPLQALGAVQPLPTGTTRKHKGSGSYQGSQGTNEP
jgi:hypothetical protein